MSRIERGLLMLLIGGALALGLVAACTAAFAATAARPGSGGKTIASPVTASGIMGIIQGIANWTEDDLNAASALATTIPELQDPVGAACWKTWLSAGAVIKAHPLPLTLKIASDIEALRLALMAIKRVCQDPNCSQVRNDIQNQAGVVVPIPMQIGSVCSKIL